MKILKGLLMIITAPVILVLTLFVWLCTGLIYISGLVLGLLSTDVYKRQGISHLPGRAQRTVRAADSGRPPQCLLYRVSSY